ncbi:ISL3 family transposase [Deinococcus sp.]|uniref:ISL3 family transposase n=2 Tax=Deinococcus sp. TaxID=47478 RepID=UPI003B5A28C2
MDLHACLPNPEQFNLTHTTITPHVVWLDVESRAGSTHCPTCGTVCARRHSHYTRTLKDLPLLGRRVRWHLTVHKFFCDAPACPQRIFCERLPDVTAPWHRATLRLSAQQRIAAFEAGAESAARILAAVGSTVSPTTLLDRLRRAPPSGNIEPVRWLGLDDWAWRKGKRYGTILVDLERHQVIDLLADRETASVVAWLAQHPEIEVITRDRSTAYQEAATLGAPQAQQIADRWHLLKNVRETLERYLLREYDIFKSIAKTLPLDAVLPVPVCRSEALPSTETSLTPSGMGPPTARQQARFAAVKTKLKAGSSIKAVAREVGVALGTVQKYLHLEQHPGNARARSRPGELAPFIAWLQAQWAAGAQNAAALYTELKTQGYGGGYTAVREYCRQLRLGTPKRPSPWACPSPRTLSWALLDPTTIRTPQVTTLLERCSADHPELTRVTALLQDGWNIFRRTVQTPLRSWLTALTSSGVRELQAFAVGIDRDYDAVQQAIVTPLSNGQVEGQVNRLKTLKRGMYGRASLPLLRSRIQYRSGCA